MTTQSSQPRQPRVRELNLLSSLKLLGGGGGERKRNRQILDNGFKTRVPCSGINSNHLGREAAKTHTCLSLPPQGVAQLHSQRAKPTHWVKKIKQGDQTTWNWELQQGGSHRGKEGAVGNCRKSFLRENLLWDLCTWKAEWWREKDLSSTASHPRRTIIPDWNKEPETPPASLRRLSGRTRTNILIWDASKQ